MAHSHDTAPEDEDPLGATAGVINGLLLLAAIGSLALMVWDVAAGFYLGAVLFGVLFVCVLALLAVELR